MLDSRASIRGFLVPHLNGLRVTDDEDIFATGYLNSLFAVQLIKWIEDAFNVPIASEDLDIGNFRTIASIEEFVERKMRRGTADQSSLRAADTVA